MMTYDRIAAVTGANKGIGLAIVRQLVLQYPKSPYNNGSFLIYLTARDKAKGEKALQAINHDEQLRKAKALRQDGGPTEVKYHQLDISKADSIRAFAEHLKKEHPSGIDYVINNAGIAMQGFDSNVVEETLHCNYYGTLKATQELLPLIKPDGRLVNVSSMAGKLHKYSDSIRDRFLAARTVDDITSLMEAFKRAVAEGTEKAQGWPSAAYAVSKAGVTGVTKAIAAAEAARGSKVAINACCPGYVNTDMTRGTGRKTPDEGAQTPVMLALADIGGRTGDFWQDERVIEW